MENNALFSEKQRFKQIWLWLLVLALNGFFIFALIKQVVFGQTFGAKPMSNTGLFIAVGITLLVAILFFSLRLETNIRKDGVYVRFFPIQRKFKYLPWNTIARSFVRQYNPLGEYGGWGMRGLGKNKALNISGNKGLQLVLEDGSKLLIGTSKPEELTTTLQQLGHS